MIHLNWCKRIQNRVVQKKKQKGRTEGDHHLEKGVLEVEAGRNVVVVVVVETIVHQTGDDMVAEVIEFVEVEELAHQIHQEIVIEVIEGVGIVMIEADHATDTEEDAVEVAVQVL